MENKIKIHGIYRHFKGDLYLVEGIAIHSDTREELALYRPLYGDSSKLFVRPLDKFIEEVEGKDQKHRFELRDIASKNPKI